MIASLRFASKSRNTPFAGRELVGAVEMTLVGGAIVYENPRPEGVPMESPKQLPRINEPAPDFSAATPAATA